MFEALHALVWALVLLTLALPFPRVIPYITALAILLGVRSGGAPAACKLQLTARDTSTHVRAHRQTRAQLANV